MKRRPKCQNCGEEVSGRWFSLWNKRETANRIYLHSSNHPLLIEANELIKKARKLEEEVRELRLQARSSIESVYDRTVHVKVAEKSGWHSDLEEGTEYIVITSILKNQQEYEDHMKEFGSLSNPPKEQTSSVKYYRVHGILLHEGGGYIVLKDKQPCSDEEWEQIKGGHIPEKFDK